MKSFEKNALIKQLYILKPSNTKPLKSLTFVHPFAEIEIVIFKIISIPGKCIGKCIGKNKCCIHKYTHTHTNQNPANISTKIANGFGTMSKTT